MPTEIEIKLRLPGEWAIPPVLEDERITAYRMRAFLDTEMESVYYDTRSGDCEKNLWSLRLRRENGVSVASCKTAGEREGAMVTRGEWQVFAEDWEKALPLLVAGGAPSGLLSLNGPLIPLCSVKFTRTAAPLRLPCGAAAEMALDRGVLSADEKQEPLLELELELLTGEAAEMVDLAAYLEDKHALTKELNSKYGRALRLLRTR
jgi:inorganic triphosphatase YgiF